jgi:uncharacterized protein
MAPAVHTRYDSDARRFEATLEGHDEVAVLVVVPATTIWTFTHTSVPAPLEGRGVGSALVRSALAHVRELGLTVRPVCPFVIAFLQRHPDEADVVNERFKHLLHRSTD